MSNVSVPEHQNVTFDNFFTSHRLFCYLNGLGYFSTGTVRDNRTSKAPLKDVKVMKKDKRGTSDFRYEKNNNIVAVPWNDNSVSETSFCNKIDSTLGGYMYYVQSISRKSQ